MHRGTTGHFAKYAMPYQPSSAEEQQVLLAAQFQKSFQEAMVALGAGHQAQQLGGAALDGHLQQPPVLGVSLATGIPQLLAVGGSGSATTSYARASPDVRDGQSASSGAGALRRRPADVLPDVPSGSESVTHELQAPVKQTDESLVRELKGLIGTMDPATRATVKDSLYRISRNATSSAGCSPTVSMDCDAGPDKGVSNGDHGCGGEAATPLEPLSHVDHVVAALLR